MYVFCELQAKGWVTSVEKTVRNTENSFSSMNYTGRSEMITAPSTDPMIAEKAAKTTVYCILLLASIVGNTLVILVVCKNPTMRTPTNLFVANMALSDILVPVFALPRVLVEILIGHRSWLIAGLIGEILCKLAYFAQDVSMTVSVQCLVLIGIDRYYAVIFPLKCAFRKPSIRGIILSTWLLAGILHSPYFYIFKLVNSHGNNYCVIDWSPLDSVAATRIFFICGHVLTFAIPMVTLVVLYSRITIKLRSQTVPGIVSLLMRERRMRRNNHVLRMAVAVVLAFFVLWTPCVIYAVLVLFFVKPDAVPESFRFVSQLLVQLNCATNFFICLIFNDAYRREFRRLCPSFLCSCRRSSNRVHRASFGATGKDARNATAAESRDIAERPSGPAPPVSPQPPAMPPLTFAAEQQ